MIKDQQSVQHAAEALQKMGAQNVVIKGGHWQHSQSEYCIDYVFMPTTRFTLQHKRYDTPHTHGTGCTFSACLAAELAKGKDITQALIIAKRFISAAIEAPLNIGKGQGPVNHWAYQNEEH